MPAQQGRYIGIGTQVLYVLTSYDVVTPRLAWEPTLGVVKCGRIMKCLLTSTHTSYTGTRVNIAASFRKSTIKQKNKLASQADENQLEHRSILRNTVIVISMATNSGGGNPIGATEGLETRDTIPPPVSRDTKASASAAALSSPIHSAGQDADVASSRNLGKVERAEEVDKEQNEQKDSGREKQRG
ncbi:hypothetical protein ACRALDRAFT_2017697 [Sodiomyces alcalophilus JCM 7366]|uniref:uncharacterized protein n=1 Tax=Sodiomyces alcalophilus JCM 7366 TaxID=591952 RepID=UPI0039B41BC2